MFRRPSGFRGKSGRGVKQSRSSAVRSSCGSASSGCLRDAGFRVTSSAIVVRRRPRPAAVGVLCEREETGDLEAVCRDAAATLARRARGGVRAPDADTVLDCLRRAPAASSASMTPPASWSTRSRRPPPASITSRRACSRCCSTGTGPAAGPVAHAPVAAIAICCRRSRPARARPRSRPASGSPRRRCGTALRFFTGGSACARGPKPRESPRSAGCSTDRVPASSRDLERGGPEHDALRRPAALQPRDLSGAVCPRPPRRGTRRAAARPPGSPAARPARRRCAGRSSARSSRRTRPSPSSAVPAGQGHAPAAPPAAARGGLVPELADQHPRARRGRPHDGRPVPSHAPLRRSAVPVPAPSTAGHQHGREDQPQPCAQGCGSGGTLNQLVPGGVSHPGGSVFVCGSHVTHGTRNADLEPFGARGTSMPGHTGSTSGGGSLV